MSKINELLYRFDYKFIEVRFWILLLNQYVNKISVCIYNIQDQLIMSKKYKSINSMNFEINEALGLYFIQFKYRNGLSSILKVIIE
ncbi:MAG: hypothetical protein DRI86_05945 [Bacteroidetes bacterium]|nr:MAG: hypothetical protein DRI86_05945 [Bacteroidota bacterium]